MAKMEVAPTLGLPCQAADQFGHPVSGAQAYEWGKSSAFYQPAVPAEQRLGRDEERMPVLTRHQGG